MVTENASRRSPLWLLLSLLAAGCSDPGPDPDATPEPTTALCERLDECNYLSAGTSVMDCSSAAIDCLDNEKRAVRDDWALQSSDCLRWNTCENFARCLDELPKCGGSGHNNDATASPDPDLERGELVEGLIQFSTMYTAFDGIHEYAVTPSVPRANPEFAAVDLVDESTLRWEVDGDYVTVEEFPELKGAVKLITKRTGTTVVKVTAITVNGVKVRGEASLIIAAAKESEWDAGEARYHNDTMIPWQRPANAAPAQGTCGLPIMIELPSMSSCGNCHNSMGSTSIEFTPTQTAGYTNDELINIFTKGAPPVGGVFYSTFLRNAPMPACLYKAFHTWDITDDEKRGVVWKLRSIAPKVHEQIDLERLSPKARE